MAADYSRVHRLLKILTLIQGGRGWTPARLAHECRTTERTIYRDLKMLQAAGVPYFYDSDNKSYSVRRDFFMPPVQLTLEETLALSALSEQIGGAAQVPYLHAAARAIAKVRGHLPASIRSELEKIEPHLEIHLAASIAPEAAEDVYEIVRHALASRCAVRCEYESLTRAQDGSRDGAETGSPEGGGDATAARPFLLHPYALFFAQRAWYVVGLHSARKQVRCLKLNRFTRVQATSGQYEIPRGFSLNNHLGNAWRMIRGNKRHTVEVHFDPSFAETIADTAWHRTQEITWHDDQSMSFRCRVDGLDEIVWWIMSMGPHCVVKKPPELIDRVRELARQTLAKYAAK